MPFLKTCLGTLLTVGALLESSLLSWAADEAVKVACVGDSITYGAGIKDRAKNSYPVQLQSLLGDSHQVRNFGNSGSTLLKSGDKPYWEQREFKDAKAFLPDVVVIKLGTNDTKPQNWKGAEAFVRDYEAMIDAFENLESEPTIYLCLPVPAFEVRWGIREKVIKDELIPATRALGKRRQLEIIDLYAALDGKGQHFPDKIHPNAAGAKIMAAKVAEALGSES